MRDRKLGKQFERWRARGDSRALGRVFDATAPELSRFALHLVRDPIEADDVVQATYLTAIERADRWDASRPLVPWLLGILANHAREQRRARQRAEDAPDVLPGEASDPAEAAQSQELAGVLREKIDELPELYRDVLVPYLVGEKLPAEIARDMGRAPGTVRMQIHRGLDLLRKALPASLALGVGATTLGGGLEAVRAEVLRRGAERATLAGAGATGLAVTWSAIGGMAMGKKLAVAGLALALMTGVTWVAASLAASPGGAGDEATRADEPGGALAVAPDEPASMAGGAATPPGPGATSEVEGATRSDVAVAYYETSLARATGRVVEADGTPVVGISVSLLELPADLLRTDLGDALEEQPRERDLEISRTTTGPDGTFRLGRAQLHAFHGLGIDLGGTRPRMFALDEAFAPGETSDLGDFVMPAIQPIRGRIVDEGGVPLAGVRVRAGDLPRDFDWASVAGLRPGTLGLVQQGMASVVVDLPAWVQPWEARVPLAVVETDADGEFVFPHAPAGVVTLLVDELGYVAMEVAVDPSDQDARDTGDLVLERGLELDGRIVDESGAGVAGAEVHGGALRTLGWFMPDIGMLSSRTTTDMDGRFSLPGLVPDEGYVVAVRRGEHERWTIDKSEQLPAAPITVKLPTTRQLIVRVTGSGGAPAPGARVAVLPPATVSILPMGALLEERRPVGAVHELVPGTFSIEGLRRGSYTLVVDAPGYGVARERVRIKRTDAEVDVELAPADELEVAVREAGTGAPLPRARVLLLQQEGSTTVLARAETGPSGVATVAHGPLGDDVPVLRIEHPGFAPTTVPLPSDEEALEVELDRGASLEVTVTHAGAAPRGPRTVLLRPESTGAYLRDEVGRIGLTDAEGRVRFDLVEPGEWEVAVMNRFLDINVLALVSGSEDRVFLGSRVVTLPGGALSKESFDVRPAPLLDPGTGRIEGVVEEDGVGVPGIEVRLQTGGSAAGVYGTSSFGSVRNATSGPDGRWGFDDLAAGEYKVTLWNVDQSEWGEHWTTIEQRELALAEDATERIDVRWTRTTCDVYLEDADGGLVVGAEVELVSLDPEGYLWAEPAVLSDERGIARPESRGSGPHRIEARHPTLGVGTAEVELVAGDAREVHVRLERPVRCAGRVTVPPLPERPEGSVVYRGGPKLRVWALEETGIASAELYLSAGDAGIDAPFELLGLPEGRYRADFVWDWVSFTPIDFDLPAGGVDDLTLEFVLPDR